jgi:hypothetical protein
LTGRRHGLVTGDESGSGGDGTGHGESEHVGNCISLGDWAIGRLTYLRFKALRLRARRPAGELRSAGTAEAAVAT